MFSGVVQRYELVVLNHILWSVVKCGTFELNLTENRDRERVVIVVQFPYNNSSNGASSSSHTTCKPNGLPEVLHTSTNN